MELVAFIQSQQGGGGSPAEPTPEQMERALQAKRDASQTTDPQFAIDLNNFALMLRKLGRFDEAVEHLEEAIELEDRLLPPEHPKRPHRRNNLAIVLMLAGKLDEAAAANAEAWRLKQGAYGGHDLTSGRILFAATALSWLEGRDAAAPICRLRTLLGRGALPCHGDIDAHWNAADILDILATRLAPDQHQFLTALVAALNSPENLPTLEAHPFWRDQPPVPLETPWNEEPS